jgi:hypothetical protein
MSGGFAGGLAQGIGHGFQIVNQVKGMKLQEERNERDKEEHGARMDEHNYNKGRREKWQTALDDISKLGQDKEEEGQPRKSLATNPDAPSFGAPTDAQATPSSIKVGGPLNGSLGQPAQAPYAADNPTAGLQSTAREPQRLSPEKQLTKGLATGAYTPERLTQMADIFAKHGFHDEGKKYLEDAYTAEKRGISRGAMSFMRGDVDGGMEALKSAGIELQDRPTKINPNDDNDHKWKVNIPGTGEQEIDLHKWMKSTFEPGEFYKTHLEEQGLAQKDKELDLKGREVKVKEDENVYKGVESAARAKSHEANASYTLGAKTALAGANAGKAGRTGGERAERPESMAQAHKRQSETIEDLSSERTEDGKTAINPQKRMLYSNIAADTEHELSTKFGREITSKERHKLASALQTLPINADGTLDGAKMGDWSTQLQRGFGITEAQPRGPQAEPAATPVAPPAAPLGIPQQPQAAAKPAQRLGGLAALQEEQAIRDQMAGIQQALQNPNLSVEQKQALALKAQEMQIRADAFYKGR